VPYHATRRQFLRTAAAAAPVGFFTSRAIAESNSPNEKLNIACVGVAGRGGANVNGVAHENIVALCDIDSKRLGGAAERFPKAERYADFRKCLDQKNIDAVTVSTPDHTHAAPTMAALKQGKHVYCEKPLTHSVFEARIVAETAKQKKVATQMGTQIHAGENYRRVVEIIRSGAIGPVSEVHVWVAKGWGGGERPKQTPPVPEHIDWDLWIGPAPFRPYHPTYIPFYWRRWWDFGNGTLGDMACHFMDLPFWALDLRYPETVEAEGPDVHPETAPLGLKVHYQFPKRDKQPPVKLTWHDGNRIPQEVGGHKVPGSGVMFIGTEGRMFANYGSYKLYPESKFADVKPPQPTIPRSIGHHREWTRACKQGTPTTCNFDYSGALTEAVLLGTVAFRVGQRLKWDAKNLKAVGCPAADELIEREYRQGWTL